MYMYVTFYYEYGNDGWKHMMMTQYHTCAEMTIQWIIIIVLRRNVSNVYALVHRLFLHFLINCLRNQNMSLIYILYPMRDIINTYRSWKLEVIILDS